jgi:hypothetical protein
MVQTPVQQLVPVEHVSNACPQKEDAWHCPPVQKPEQHCEPVEQPLPSVLQVVLRAAHEPPVHVWLQQSPFAVQCWPSEVQAGYEHEPPLHTPLQQSPATLHAPPKPRHMVLPGLPNTPVDSEPSPINPPLLAPLLPPPAPSSPPPAPSTVPSRPPSAGVDEELLLPHPLVMPKASNATAAAAVPYMPYKSLSLFTSMSFLPWTPSRVRKQDTCRPSTALLVP